MKHEAKQCPRCYSEFECKLGNIQLCQCSGVSLSDEEMDYLQQRYDDCLCVSCLRELQQQLTSSASCLLSYQASGHL